VQGLFKRNGKISVLERPAKAGRAEAGRRPKAKNRNPDFPQKKFEFRPKGTAKRVFPPKDSLF